jgi:hypothetical protein
MCYREVAFENTNNQLIIAHEGHLVCMKVSFCHVTNKKQELIQVRDKVNSPQNTAYPPNGKTKQSRKQDNFLSVITLSRPVSSWCVRVGGRLARALVYGQSSDT